MITYSGLNICSISALMKFHLNDSQRKKKHREPTKTKGMEKEMQVRYCQQMFGN